MPDIDTSNASCVTRDMAGMLWVQNPLPLMGKPLTPDAALTLASWLVALADGDGAVVLQSDYLDALLTRRKPARFSAILDRVLNT